MPINLVKGQNHVLNMNIFHVGLGWDVNEDVSSYDFDLDVSAFMVNANHKIPTDDYLVFYNSENRLKVYLEGRLELESVKRIRKVEIINKVKMLRDEITDMEEILKTEILNEDTKDFFKLAFNLYGQDIIDSLRKATSLSDAERNNLIGKFDLLNQIIIPFYK